jgi:hypothetical protein
MLTTPVASAWVRFPEPNLRNKKSELVEAELSALVLYLREQINRGTFSFYPSIPHQLNRNSFSWRLQEALG